MNSINIGWDSTKQAEMPYFHCGISGQKGNERKWKTGKTKKKTKTKQKQKKHLRMNKSKENTLIYEHMYIYTHSQTFKQINIDAHIHIFT